MTERLSIPNSLSLSFLTNENSRFEFVKDNLEKTVCISLDNFFEKCNLFSYILSASFNKSIQDY